MTTARPGSNDDDAHVAMRNLNRSYPLEGDNRGAMVLEFVDGTRAWVTPGMGVSFPDASKDPEQIALEKRIRELEREVNELHNRLGNTVRNLVPPLRFGGRDLGGGGY